MWSKGIWTCAIMFVSGMAQAQAPLSAIDWLDRPIEAPQTLAPNETPVAPSASVEEVTVAPLNADGRDGVGLLSIQAAGLPAELWRASDPKTLRELLHDQPVHTLPALQELLFTLLLAEAPPPLGATNNDIFLLARIDTLLAHGALTQAAALLERAGSDDPHLFHRWFDISLLLGREDAACDTMREQPETAPTLQARIFCLAREGDWNAAALTLQTAQALGDVGAAESALLTRFLNPDLDETGDDLLPFDRVTPLAFRMFEAVGEPIPTRHLPLLFANIDLHAGAGWKAQIEAAERLAAVGTLPPSQLFAIYQARRPAASGGVWTRVAAQQALLSALNARNPGAVAETLASAWAEMMNAGLSQPFARHAAAGLMALPLAGDAGALAFRIALLTPHAEDVARARAPENAVETFLVSLARGQDEIAADPIKSPLSEAITRAFSTDRRSIPQFDALARSERLGEALLKANLLLREGRETDPDDVTAALSFYRSVGLENVARAAALQLLLPEIMS